jgi:uncharacterized protein YgbK (DUF1537 family)
MRVGSMLKLGVIADDFTGATDIAGFLVAGGLSTIQLNGVPREDIEVEADAVVISLKSRSSPVDEAVAESLRALEWLSRKGCAQFYFKYCSTFDSTPAGNIGPVVDALLDALRESFTVICPALPVNGRTVYNGYLFVGGVPLDESGMRHHPVTPMTDANLMRLMDAQAAGRTGLVPSTIVGAGSEAIRQALAELARQGFRYGVVDVLCDDHLAAIGVAVSGMRLVTGGSGLAGGIVRALGAERGSVADMRGRPSSGRAVVLSGSCSQMTNAQVAQYRRIAGAKPVSVERCIADASGYADDLAAWVCDLPRDALAPMIYATTDAGTLSDIQSRFGAAGASAAVEGVLAAVAGRLAEAGFERFIVAGGETSGAVTQALGIAGFHIGPQIAPGVPWVRAIDRPISLALKSGNFGGENFFADAQDAGG